MTEGLGRRDYDARITPDHDLLVRIDERLGVHLKAHADFLREYAADKARTDERLKQLEDERRERMGADRANARFVALIVACSSVVTAVAVKIAEKMLA